jgi:hypothetical protein
MSFEIPVILAEWLKDPTYGANAILATVPHDVGDVPKPYAAVRDTIRDGWIARAEITPEKLASGPVLGVLQSGEAVYPFAQAQFQLEGGKSIQGSGSWLLLDMQRESDSAQAASQARYRLRAAFNSLILLEDPKSAAARERNGVEIVCATQFQMSTLKEERGEVLVTGGVLVTYTTRELVQYRI